MALPYIEDIFSEKSNIDFIHEFLEMDGAKEEPSCFQVKATYGTIMDVSRKKNNKNNGTTVEN
eukprot:15361075-Ditylum_brightwellii.AAC.1